MAKENTPQQEEMVDIGVFLKDPALVEILNGSITAYNSRPYLEKNLRYNRTPEDSFIEANNFNAMWLIDEFLKITTKKSTLSAAQRECVNRYVVGAMQKLYDRNLKKKTEEAKNGNKEESGDKGPLSE